MKKPEEYYIIQHMRINSNPLCFAYLNLRMLKVSSPHYNSKSI